MAGDGDDQLVSPEARRAAPLRDTISRLLRRRGAADADAHDAPPPPPDAEAPPPPEPDAEPHAGRAHGLARQRVGPHEEAHADAPLDTASARRFLLGGAAAAARRGAGGGPGAPPAAAASSERGSVPLDGIKGASRTSKAGSLLPEDSIDVMSSQVMLPEHAAKLVRAARPGGGAPRPRGSAAARARRSPAPRRSQRLGYRAAPARARPPRPTRPRRRPAAPRAAAPPPAAAARRAHAALPARPLARARSS